MNRTLFLLFFSFVISMNLVAENTKEKDRMAILEFGIESDIQGLLKDLNIEKEKKYNEKIYNILLKTKSRGLKDSIYKFFAENKEKIAEDSAIEELVKAKDNSGSAIAQVCLYYLGEILSTKAESALVDLIESKNKALSVLAIRTLGRIKAKNIGKKILDKIEDPNFDENLKGDLIWTLGELEFSEALKPLSDLLETYAEKPVFRQIILEAIGKLKTNEAYTELIKSIDDENALVRAKVISSLGNFPGTPETENFLLTALRDNQTVVRLAGIEALKKNKLPSLLPGLKFKIKKDPDPKVRSAALRTLFDWDMGQAEEIFKELIKDKEIDLALWNETLSLASEKKIPSLSSMLMEVLIRDKDEKNSFYSDSIARFLTQRNSLDLKNVYQNLLQQSKDKKIAALNGIAINKIKGLEENIKALKDNEKEDSVVRKRATEVLKDLESAP